MAATTALSSAAHATNVTEFPDNGSEQMARGGAWVARASDPLAVHFNPAGLAGQRTALSLQANLSLGSTCFARIKAANDTTSEPYMDATGRKDYPEVCTEKHLFPNPQLAFNYHVSDRVGVGFAVLGPSGVGEHKWPTFIDADGASQPAPQRYLLIEGKSTYLTPTIGVGAEVIDNLRLGVAFEWGIIKAKFSNGAPALNGNNQNPKNNDTEATLIVADYFVPGVKLGAMYSPIENLDIGAWFKWTDSIKARGDAYIRGNAFTDNVAKGDKKGVTDTDTSMSDCNGGQTVSGVCGDGNNATLKLIVPMEAKLGFRFHQPRVRSHAEPPPPAQERIIVSSLPHAGRVAQTTPPGTPGTDGANPPPASGTPDANAPVVDAPATPAPAPAPEPMVAAPRTSAHLRDPMATDLFDAEIDFTWANNSAFDNLEIRFPGNAVGDGVIPVTGIPGVVPPNADVPHRYKDVFGVRVGGDINVLPNQFTLRLGGYYETRAQDDVDQNIDFMGGSRIGVAGGAQYRVPVGESSLDLMLGFMHVFVAEQHNEGPNGVFGLAGAPCNPTVDSGPCEGGRQRYRTIWPVNLGTITNSLNVINVGATYRFK